MSRGRRCIQQLQQTARIKLAILENQKNDISQMIDEYASEIIGNAKVLLDEQSELVKDSELYQQTLHKLDKASEVLTEIAIQLDSILDANESCNNLEKAAGSKMNQESVPVSAEEPQIIESMADKQKWVDTEGKQILGAFKDHQCQAECSKVEQVILPSQLHQQQSEASPPNLDQIFDSSLAQTSSVLESENQNQVNQNRKRSTKLFNNCESTLYAEEPSSVNNVHQQYLHSLPENPVTSSLTSELASHQSDGYSLMYKEWSPNAGTDVIADNISSQADEENNYLHSSENSDEKILHIKPKRNEIFAVLVSDVENPWFFHLQFISGVKSIADEIRVAVGSGWTKATTPTLGLYCLAKLRGGQCYRARVLELEESDGQIFQVRVLAIDYGEKQWVPASNISTLPSALKKYPYQTLFCALSGVCPKNSQNLWTEEATLQFRHLVHHQQATARFVCLSQDRHRPHIVDLIVKIPATFQTSAAKKGQLLPQSVASVLIRKGCAKAIDTEDLKVIINSFEPLMELDDLISNSVSHSLDKGHISSVPLKDKFSLVQHHSLGGRLTLLKKSPLTAVDVIQNSGSVSSKKTTSENLTTELKVTAQMADLYELGIEVNKKLYSLGIANKLGLKAGKIWNSLDALEQSRQDSDSKLVCAEDVHINLSSSLPDNASDVKEVEILVMLSTVISPASFFVHIVDQQSGHNLQHVRKELNMTFERYSISALISLSKSFTPQKNMLCCALFSEDGYFYRGLVLDVKSADKDIQSGDSSSKDAAEKLLVFFLDYGNFEWVTRGKVYPLPEEFKQIQPMALWCKLLYVIPKEVPAYDEALEWHVNVVEKFKSMVCGEKILSVVASEAAWQNVNNGGHFQSEPLLVYLLDRNDDGEEFCLNFELIDRDLANLKCPPQEAIVPQTSDGSTLEQWDPMFEEFYSIRNSYMVNPEESGVALVGYSMTYDKVPVLVFDENQSDLLPEPNSFVAVTVSTVITPSNFYVTLPWGPLTLSQVRIPTKAQEETLEALMDSMQDYYKNSVLYDGDLTLLAPGQAMAAKIMDHWLRVKVIDTDVERGLVQLMSIDFGSVDWVNEKDIRQLDLKFIHLSPQAVQCSLADLVPKASSDDWTEEACKQFGEMVMGKVLVAWVKYRFPCGRLSVHIFDTSGGKEVDLNQQLVTADLAEEVVKTQQQTSAEMVAGEASDDLNTERFQYMPV